MEERPTLKQIIKKTCTERDIKVKHLLVGFRWKEHVWTRSLIIAQARKHGYSYPEIGRALKMHHTSIMYLDGKFPNKKQHDKEHNVSKESNEAISGS